MSLHSDYIALTHLTVNDLIDTAKEAVNISKEMKRHGKHK